MIPKYKYAKCIECWDNGPDKRSVVGKIYDTSIPQTFSVYEWSYILKYPKKFVEAAEDEFFGQQSILENPILY